MAAVTGYTAEHMDALVADNIISGEVVGDDLILKTRSGVEIDAGNVRGPGDPGVAGPNSSVDNNVAVFDGITGKTIKDSNVSIDLISGLPGVVDSKIYNLEKRMLTNDAQQNVQIWELQAALLKYQGNFDQWLGEPFLIGSDFIESMDELIALRSVRLGEGGCRFSAGGDVWQASGLLPQVSTADSSNLGTMVSGNTTGSWRSVDGNTWVQTDTHSNMPSPTIVYVGNSVWIKIPHGAPYTIRRSIDDGVTWLPGQTFSGTQISNIVSDGNGLCLIGIYGSTCGISLDYGATWAIKTLSGGANNTPQPMILSPIAWCWFGGDTNYAPKAWITTNGGTTITALPTPVSYAYSQAVSDGNGTGIATSGASFNGAAITVDHGVTWTQLSGSRGLQAGASLTGVVRGKDGVWMLNSSKDGLCISLDNAVSWTPYTWPGRPADLNTTKTDGKGIWYSYKSGTADTLWISRDNANTWYKVPGTQPTTGGIIAGATFWISIGQATTYYSRSTALEGSCILQTATLSKTATEVYVLSDSEFENSDISATYYASLDGGVHWTECLIGDITTIEYPGTEFSLKVSIERTTPELDGIVHWFIGYAK